MARYHLAVAYFTKGDWDQAAREFKTITLKTPENSASHYYLGLSYKETGKLEKAAACFKKSLELEPHNQRVKRELENLEKLI